MAMLSQIFGGDEQTTLDVAQQPDDPQALSTDASDTAREADASADDSDGANGIDRVPEDEQFDTLNPQFGATADDPGA